jgi:hypothetical protein
LEALRLQRIRSSLRVAAEQGRILHLWWHPHNFGLFQEENLAFLRNVLIEFDRCREEHGMQSMSMIGADDFLNWEGQRGGQVTASVNGKEPLALAGAAR